MLTKGGMDINKGTRTIILIMLGVVAIGLGIAYSYYGNINKSEDPRVLGAKQLYKNYTLKVDENDAKAATAILDSIESIYHQFPDYERSFEMGVILNNKASVCITQALYLQDEVVDKGALLDSAEHYVRRSILLYEAWLSEFENLSEEEILKIVETYYLAPHPSFEGKDMERIIAKRSAEIVEAKNETLKRLSVAYTNLGIIQRHFTDYNAAMESYKKALSLWAGNLSATNGIRILLGQPLKEATFIEKLFPPEKD